MQMKSLAVVSATLVLATSFITTHSVHAQAASAGSTSCAPVGDLSFVCGVVNVEDFLPVEDGRWLVAGSLQPGSAGLYLIDTAAKTFKAVDLSIAAEPDPRYPCA